MTPEAESKAVIPTESMGAPSQAEAWTKTTGTTTKGVSREKDLSASDANTISQNYQSQPEEDKESLLGDASSHSAERQSQAPAVDRPNPLHNDNQSSSGPKGKGKKVSGTKKGGPSSERDSVNALLSLGRDLQAEQENAEKEASASNVMPSTGGQPPVILPLAQSAPPPKKRQKQASTLTATANGASYQYPADFWYWLSPGESIGDFDVLCGRGGESNNYIGNKKYRKVVDERKDVYRNIPLKQRKSKTAFVRSIVQHVNNCGGRFVDLDDMTGKYFVVTMEKARKKTSQALRETKELKWLELEAKGRKIQANKSSICPYCKIPGHKTKIAKACRFHHEWLDSNTNNRPSGEPDGSAINEDATAQGDSQVTDIEPTAKKLQGPTHCVASSISIAAIDSSKTSSSSAFQLSTLAGGNTTRESQVAADRSLLNGNLPGMIHEACEGQKHAARV